MEGEARNTLMGMLPTVIVGVASSLISAMLAWGVMSARVSVVEEQHRSADARLNRIESKIDTLMDRQCRCRLGSSDR